MDDLQRAQKAKAEAEVTRLTTRIETLEAGEATLRQDCLDLGEELSVMEEYCRDLRARIHELEAERDDLRRAFKTVSEVPVTTGGWQECVGLLSRLLALAHDELQKFEDDMCDRDARLDTLEAEVEEYDRTIIGQQARLATATAAWREAHPGHDLVWPDLGTLLSWLLRERAPT